MINAIQLKITKPMAAFGEIVPAGISLIAVRGFFASKCLSAQRLNAIAAERANTIHKRTFNANGQLNVNDSSVIANVNPIAAKGSANRV